MNSTTLLNQVKNLIQSGDLSEKDLAAFVSKKVSVNINAGNKAKITKKKVSSTTRKPVKRIVYADGRSNKHAILLAISSFYNGCNSTELRTKLVSMEHSMITNVFHASRSMMQHKEKLIKSSGAFHERVYKLTIAGKKLLDNYELSCLTEKHSNNSYSIIQG